LQQYYSKIFNIAADVSPSMGPVRLDPTPQNRRPDGVSFARVEKSEGPCLVGFYYTEWIYLHRPTQIWIFWQPQKSLKMS
jgi:hypothetical protein